MTILLNSARLPPVTPLTPFIVSPGEHTFDFPAGTFTLSSTIASWSISVNPGSPWITLSGQNTNDVMVTVSENTLPEIRYAVIRLRENTNNRVAVFTINQYGTPQPPEPEKWSIYMSYKFETDTGNFLNKFTYRLKYDFKYTRRCLQIMTYGFLKKTLLMYYGSQGEYDGKFTHNFNDVSALFGEHYHNSFNPVFRDVPWKHMGIVFQDELTRGSHSSRYYSLSGQDEFWSVGKEFDNATLNYLTGHLWDFTEFLQGRTADDYKGIIVHTHTEMKMRYRLIWGIFLYQMGWYHISTVCRDLLRHLKGEFPVEDHSLIDNNPQYNLSQYADRLKIVTSLDAPDSDTKYSEYPSYGLNYFKNLMLYFSQMNFPVTSKGIYVIVQNPNGDPLNFRNVHVYIKLDYYDQIENIEYDQWMHVQSKQTSFIGVASFSGIGTGIAPGNTYQVVCQNVGQTVIPTIDEYSLVAITLPS